MKGLFKLTTAALALVTFASCSSEDFFGNGQQAQQKKGILVEVEEMVDGASTRAAYTPNGKTASINFTSADKIKVTDGTLVKYDVYGYDGGSFVFDKAITGRDAAWIAEPEYASLAGQDGQLVPMEWDNAAKQAIGYYTIGDANGVVGWYDDGAAPAEVTGAYYSELPLWGTAAADDTYGVKVSMKYLTGILKLNLENAPSNVTGLKIEGYANVAGTIEAPMSGAFKAILANDDEINEDAQLIVDDTKIQGNVLYVDLRNASSYKTETVVLVPIIAQNYGQFNVYYTSNDPGAGTSISSVAPAQWTLKVAKTNLNVKRKAFYNLNLAGFSFKGADTPSAINDILNDKASESEINVATAATTTVYDGENGTGANKDNTIIIPQTSANITLDLQKLVKTTGAGTGVLHIVNAEGADYAGTFTLKVNATGSDLDRININLPNANVVIDGSLSGIDLGKDGTAPNNTPDSLVVKTLTVGTTGTVANIYANAELGLTNTDGADLMIADGGNVTGNIEFETNYTADNITINGTLGTALDFSAWTKKDGTFITPTVNIGGHAAIAGLISTRGVANIAGDANMATGIYAQGNINISGNAIVKQVGTTSAKHTITVGGNAQLTSGVNTQNGATLIVKDKAVVKGGIVKTLTIQGEASVGDVTVAEDATIAIDADKEVEAITTSLTMNAGKTLNLNGGYIKKLVITADGVKKLDIKHGSAAAYTAIGQITSTAFEVDRTTKSVWNGKTIGTAFASYAAETEDAIFTAMELATIKSTANAVTLYSNIDLNNEKWTKPAAAFKALNGTAWAKGTTPETFDYPTISNVKLMADGDADGVGLFATSTHTDGVTISNLNINKVTTTLNATTSGGKTFYPQSIGTVIGKATKAATLTNVKITNATLTGTDYSDNVGGMVGQAEGALIVNGGSAIETSSVKGQYYVGGIVGYAAGNLTVGSTKVNLTTISVPTRFNHKPNIEVDDPDIKAGSIGMVAGLAKGTTTSITFGGAYTCNDLITGKRQTLGFKLNYQNPGTSVVYYFGPKKTNKVYVGQLEDDPTTKGYKVNETADYTKAKDADALYIKHDLYDNYDK